MKESSPRTGRAFLWSLLAVIGGIGATSLLVAQTMDPPEPVSEQAPEASAAPVGRTISLTAADLVQAGETEPGTRASLFNPDNIEVPAEADGKTVAAAVEEIAHAAGRRLEYLATNVVDALQDPYVAPVKTSTASYAELLRQILPAGYASWSHDDGVYLFVGAESDINRKRTEYDVERLSNNHTAIAFAANDMTLYDAVLKIRSLSKANILTSFMDKEDQHSDANTQEGGTINVSDIGGGTNAVSNCRRVTYSTDGAEMEWRTVLSSVLEPDYTFDEVDGKVRVATRERFAAMHKRDQDAKPMELRYVRVYHANPEDIVARLADMKVTQNSRAIIQVAPYQEKAKKDNVNSFRHNLSSTSSRISVGATSHGDTSSGSSGSWGNLLRPKNPPAILVYDNTENLDHIEKIIRSMDVREKQILIEALILNLTDSGLRELGMNLDEMGFGNLPLFGVNYSRDHYSTHTSDNSGTWSGGTSRGDHNYVGRGRGTSPETTKETTTTKIINASGKELFSNDSTKNTETPTGIAPSWAYGNVSESFVSGDASTKTSYEKTSGSKRNHAWSTVFGPLDFKFILQLVEQNSYGKALSSPEITIGDHSEAMIHVGNVRPIVQTKVSYSGDNATPIQSYEWEELLLGLHMWVGPEVTEDGNSVRLWVHPKITDDQGADVYAPDGSSYPRLVSEEIDTRVIVPSGATLLLGGLTRTSEGETKKKVPFLGDIPLLGRLFRWNSHQSKRENLVILIRPTILDDEKPDTGFEAPANAIIDPMMATSGRNLKDVVFSEDDDKMKQREKAILKAICKKADEAPDTTETDAELDEIEKIETGDAEAAEAAEVESDK